MSRTGIVQELGPVTLFFLPSGTSCGLEPENVPSAALLGGHWLACHSDLAGFTHSALKPGFARGRLECCSGMALSRVSSRQN